MAAEGTRLSDSFNVHTRPRSVNLAATRHACENRGPMAPRRISVPITLTSTLVAITIALTVGWQILLAREVSTLVDGFTGVHWLLVFVGSLFFLLIITASILQTIWLVREIRTNQRQQSFIDAVTHELHTPLSSLRLYLDTLGSRSLDEGRRAEFIEVMGSDLDRLQRTIDQILAAARTELRTRRRNRVDLRALLGEVVSDARERHELAQDAVRLAASPAASVRGDAAQLRVVFRNLIENAIRYTRGPVRVDVRIRPVSGRRLEVEFSDEGLGIPSSALRGVFQRFSRLSNDVVRTTRGLGLGLYIVRNVVRAHGGSVRAESEGEGTGSRFIVRLPGELDEHTSPAG